MEEQRTTIPLSMASILEATTEFASFPGLHNDASVKEFLDRFPLSMLFGALQSEVYVPGLEDSVVVSLEKIFATKYGASLLPNYGPFLQAGLQANSEAIRSLACKAVCSLMEKTEDTTVSVQTIVGCNIYPLLINCLLDGNEQTSGASIDAIKSIAQLPEGINIIFSAHGGDSIQLKDLAARSSSLGRIRILALITKLYSVSSLVAKSIHESNLLKLFESEINNRDDSLSALSAMELLYELVESPHSELLHQLQTTLDNTLISTMSDPMINSELRSRAALIIGRLISSANSNSMIDKSYIKKVASAIGRGKLVLLESEDTNEIEIALESLGLIGAKIEGANVLLTDLFDISRKIAETAFNRQNRGKQMSALLALGSICGADQSEDKILLDDKSEESLKRLFYATAANSSKLTPSGLILSVLQQEPEVRLSAYRLISALVRRQWGLAEVCSKQEIISVLTDANIETNKNGMDARYNCCVAINNNLSASGLIHDAIASGIAEKLQEAVKRGPYLTKKKVEAQPIVGTMERF